MHCFYCETENVTEGHIRITGPDVNHMKNVLRMKEGETLTVCDGTGMEYFCEIAGFTQGEADLYILKKGQAQTELPVKLVLYQGLPKKDKMELIVQKAVELGAAEIVPVMMRRCIVRLEDEKKEAKKLERWQAIAESAAKQSKRMIIPEIQKVMKFSDAIKYAQELDVCMIPYELAENMQHTRQFFEQIKPGQSIGIFIGPEGGFSLEEVKSALEHEIEPVTLGKRILRTETAGLAVMSILMYLLEDRSC